VFIVKFTAIVVVATSLVNKDERITGMNNGQHKLNGIGSVF